MLHKVEDGAAHNHFFADLVQEHGVSTSVDSLGSKRPFLSWRQAVWWGCVAALMATAEVRADALSPESAAPQAMGVIVKLKDGRVTTADGRGMARPSSLTPETAQRRRMQIAQVAQRQRVSYLVQKDTVFGAQVLHRGEPVALKDAEAEAVRLRQDPDVEWAVPNEIMKAASVTAQTPNDVDYTGRYWIRSRAAAGAGVADFPAAWTFLTSLPASSLNPVVTAVLDSGVTGATTTGVPATHPDFSGRLFTGYDFVTDSVVANDGDGRDADIRDPGDWEAGCPGDPTVCSSWHGTSITSMLAAPYDSTNTGNRMGPGILAPIAGQAVVLPIRVGGTGGASSSDIIEAMYWAAGLSVSGVPNNANPARVISLSYGSVGNCQGGVATVDALYRNAIATLRSLGVVIVASAGNGNGSTAGYATPSKPASCQGVIASTGLQSNASKAAYANLVNGTRASQCYFGVAVASENLAMLGNTGTTVPLATNVQSGIRGTSFAAPQVAGVAALMLAVNPSLSSVDVAYRIMQSATTFPTSGGSLPSTVCSSASSATMGNCVCTTSTCGAGVLNAAAALAAAQNAPLLSEGMCPSPDVETSSSSKGGGGGGGSSDIGMLALLAVLATWMLGSALWQRRQARQAVPAFIKTGTR